MGNRYNLTIVCPKCGKETEDVWYAPTWGVSKFPCNCGHIVDLGQYTGISYEEASNKESLGRIIERFEKIGKEIIK